MALQQQFPDFSVLLDIFILDQRAQGHTSRTVGKYRDILGRFIV